MGKIILTIRVMDGKVRDDFKNENINMNDLYALSSHLDIMKDLITEMIKNKSHIYKGKI